MNQLERCQQSGKSLPFDGDTSQLTVNQYQNVDVELKVRFNNRVRQCALKARQNLPDEHNLFCLVVSHLLKNSHRYFKLDSPSEFQRHILEDRNLSKETQHTLMEKFRKANKQIREVGTLKGMNRISEQQELVTELRTEFKSLRNIASVSGISVKTVQKWYAPPSKKVHKATALCNLRKEEFLNFLMQDKISFEHPSKKFSGKRFLRDTLEITRQKYLQDTDFHQHGIISMSTMKAYRPPNILLCGDTPLDMCLSDRCENCEQLLRTLIAIGMKEIPGNRYAAVNAVLCPERNLQEGNGFGFPKMECIRGECAQCGESQLQERIESANRQILLENRLISWRQWISRTGKTAQEKCQIRGRVRQALAQLIDIVRLLKSHLFRANWNRNVFDSIRKNLHPGYIVQIFDFAQNFRNMHQDEVQSAYWAGMQTGIHAVINYFLCPNASCRNVVTLVLVQITEDPGHDSFVARTAHNAAFKFLVDLGIPLTVIMQFCDNCSSQYKSQHPFAELARHPFNIIRVYFGEKHGKSQCDGFFGRLKSWMSYKIKT